jgi:hypothetical protein
VNGELVARVVYLLGAGFSQPLGVPVMSDFIIQSKNLYFGDRADRALFGEVFDRIDRLHKVKSFFEADLFNIEEVLSILEMVGSLGDEPRVAEKYRQYLRHSESPYAQDCAGISTKH